MTRCDSVGCVCVTVRDGTGLGGSQWASRLPPCGGGGMFRGVVRKDGPPASGGVWPHLPEPPPGCSGVPLGRCGLVSPADKSHPHPCRQRAGRLGFKQQPQHPPPARGPAPRGTCPPSSPQCGSARCGPPPVPPWGSPLQPPPAVLCGPSRPRGRGTRGWVSCRAWGPARAHRTGRWGTSLSQCPSLLPRCPALSLVAQARSGRPEALWPGLVAVASTVDSAPGC